jgi:hypothetical protein
MSDTILRCDENIKYIRYTICELECPINIALKLNGVSFDYLGAEIQQVFAFRPFTSFHQGILDYIINLGWI